MPRFQQNDLRFEVPDDWHDRTVVAYAAPLKPGKKVAPNLVVTRDTLDAEEPVGSYADRQLVELARRLDGFALLGRRDVTLGDVPAVEMTFTWDGASGTLQQKQAFVVLRRRTVVSITATALKKEFPDWEPKFQAILASVKFPEARS